MTLLTDGNGGLYVQGAYGTTYSLTSPGGLGIDQVIDTHLATLLKDNPDNGTTHPDIDALLDARLTLVT